MQCTKILCSRQRLVFQFIAVLEEKERYCRFKKDGATAILRTQQLSCRNSSVIALRPQGPTPPDPILRRFRKERVYVNNQRKLKDLKQNTKGAVACTDQQTLIKCAKDT